MEGEILGLHKQRITFKTSKKLSCKNYKDFILCICEIPISVPLHFMISVIAQIAS